MGAGKMSKTNNLVYNKIPVKQRNKIQYLELRDLQMKSCGRSKEKDMTPNQGRRAWETRARRGQKKLHGGDSISNRS